MILLFYEYILDINLDIYYYFCKGSDDMLDRIFEIDSFNAFSDDNYYYFFRALNMADNNDIETGITLNSSGTIERIRTNLERYKDIPKYTSDDKISLEQVFDHIKMHQRKDTNCISLTSIDLSHLFTENVRNMSSMLYNCYSLNFSNIYEFNTTNVVDRFR